MKPDIIIVGQGLAGSILAWTFIKEGYNICVVDQHRKNSASQISQGLMSPVVGLRMTLSWNFQEHDLAATTFYQEIEKKLSCSLLYDLPNQRLFQSKSQSELLTKRLSQKYFPSSINATFCQKTDTDETKRPYGSLITTGKRLDVPLFLSRIEHYLLQKKSLLQDSFSYDTLSTYNRQIKWNNKPILGVVFCEGYQYQSNPWFNWLPIDAIKGQLLILQDLNKNPFLSKHLIYKQSWLNPIISTRQFATGASFERQYKTITPTTNIKETLLKQAQDLFIEKRNFKLINHLAGIRPCSQDRKPIVGPHPVFPSIYIFNGFGSKGSLWIPYWAKKLVQTVGSKQDLTKLVHPNRFITHYE